MFRVRQERWQRIKTGALNDTHCEMEARAVLDDMFA